MKKNLLLLAAIIILGSLLRLIWLDKVPHSVNGDELYYLLSAKSFYLTGKDLNGTTTLLDIFLFHYPKGHMVQAELPYILEMVTVGPFGFSLLAAFLPNAVVGILIIPLMYLITKKLLNEQIALVSGFLTAINPWFIFIGRTSYEMIPATFFYLCAFYILLVAKRWAILLALPVFLLAFYSYIGTKIILLPVAVIFVLYSWLIVHKKQFIKQYAVLLGTLLLFVVFYAFQLTHSGGPSRLSEIPTPSSPEVTISVNEIRKASITNPLLSLFENKLTVFSIMKIEKVFNTLSPDYLFVHGDQFTFQGKYGLFSWLDFVFFIVGAGWLFLHKRKISILLGTLIIISIIPHGIHNTKTNFTPHISLLFPFFIILIATGAWSIFTWLKEKKQNIIIAAGCLIYTFFIGYFINIYFFQMPLQPEFFNFSNRLVSRYITLSEQTNQNIILYTSVPDDKLNSHIFYSNLSPLQPELHKVTFRSCNKSIKKINTTDLIIVEAQCGMSFKKPHLSIPQLSDSGAAFHIYNDKLCKNYKHNAFISNLNLNDFNVEQQSTQSFCKRFVFLQ